jgi:hypothetical protein
MDIKQHLSTAYHPQTNGETERVNQELKPYIQIFTSNNTDQWASHLHLAEFAHNVRTHSARRMSPFMIQIGYNPKMFPTVTGNSHIPRLETRLKELGKL